MAEPKKQWQQVGRDLAALIGYLASLNAEFQGSIEMEVLPGSRAAWLRQRLGIFGVRLANLNADVLKLDDRAGEDRSTSGDPDWDEPAPVYASGSRSENNDDEIPF